MPRPWPPRWGLETPAALDEAAFLAYVGQRQPSSLHLAEYIYQEWRPLLQAKRAATAAALAAATDPHQRQQLQDRLDQLDNLVPDGLREDWLGPETNPGIVFPLRPHPTLPTILRQTPEELLESLVPLHPCQMILNLAV